MDGSVFMAEMDLGQVFTTSRVAEYMAGLFTIRKDGEMLDPCFGGGAFINALRGAGYSKISGYELDKALFARFPAQGLTLWNSDFLAADEGRQYDGIIMNPPYVRQEKIDLLRPLGISKAKLRKNPAFAALPASANLYMYFIVKAVQLLRPAGELVVIFPDSWFKARNGQAFRRYLYQTCCVEENTVISGQVFEENALVEVVILKLKKGAEQRTAAKRTYIEVADGEMHVRGGSVHTAIPDLPIPFSALARVRRGITTGCNAMFINPGFTSPAAHVHMREILSTPKAVTGYTTQAARTDSLFALEEAAALPREIEAYLAGWRRKIVREKAPKTLFRLIKANAPWYRLRTADCRGILFSYFVRGDMKFILNERDILVRDNFYIIYPDISEGLMFALLNNHFTYCQLEAAGKRYGAGLLKLQRYDIENLTFPDISALTAQDTKRLEALARALADTGDRAHIAEITHILAPYCGFDGAEMIKQHADMKKSRLEQAWR